MRRVLALLSAVLGVLGLSAAPASAAAAPRPAVAHLHAASTSSATLTLTWTNPHSSSFRSTVIRYAAGTKAPKTVTSGHLAGHTGAHTHTLKLGHLAAGHHYAFALFPVLTHHRYGARSGILGLVAPAAVTGALPYVVPGGMQIRWTNPHTATFHKIVVRYAAGSAAPTSPGRGHGVALSSARPASAVVTHLTTNTHYSVSVFAVDAHGGYSTPAVTRFTSPSAPDRAGTYAGTVTDSSHAPLAGATVDASAFDSIHDYSTVTGVDGTFSLPLPADEYFVTIDGQHITGGSTDASGYAPDNEDVVVRAGHASTARIVLKPGGAITGTFTDAAGHPLAGVTPIIESVGSYVVADGIGGGFESFTSGGGFQAGDVSGHDGTFIVRGVPHDGAVRLCADTSGAVTGGSDDAAGYSSDCATRTAVVAAGASAAVPTLALGGVTGGSVTGAVTVAGNHVAVPGAFVNLQSAGMQSDSFFGFTDDRGRFVINDVPAGTYQVCAGSDFVSSRVPTGLQSSCDAQPVTVTANAPAVANVSLPLGAAVTGTVRGPGSHRVAGADVEADDTSDNGPGIFGGGPDSPTNSQGQYTVTGVPTGSYAVCVTPSSTATALLPTGVQPGCVNGGKAVHLSAGSERSGLDVTLPAGSALSGTVTDTAGHGVAAAVDVESVDSEDFNGAEAIADPAGHYTVAGLPADTYHVCFSSVDASGGQAEQCAAHTVTTRIGHTATHVDGQLPETSAIRVTVTDASSGDPVAGVNATAIAECTGGDDECDTEPVFSTTTHVAVDASFTTDSDGQATLSGIAPGTPYAVCLFAYDGTTASGGSPTGYADTCTGPGFQYSVARGATQDVAMTLHVGGAVTGTVTDESGHPLGGAQATVSNSAATDFDDSSDFSDSGPNADSPLSGGVSAGDGTFTVIGVQPGSQTVCFDATSASGGSSPAGYLGRCLGGAPGSTSGGTTVSVSAGAVTTGADVVLTPAAGISGRLHHGRSPIPALQGLAVVFANRSVHQQVAQAFVGASGSYLVSGLAPGSYQVCFVTRSYGGQCWNAVAWDPDNQPPLDKATSVGAAAGAVTAGIDADLQ